MSAADMRGEYEFEPIPGLPEELPAGETLLWQGSPDWKNTAMRVLHIRGTALYFAALLTWYAVSKLGAGDATDEVMLGVLRLGLFALAALSLMTVYAWFSAKSTVYSVTSRRVVMRVGIALPMILNLPFGKIESADIKTYADGSGDIALTTPPRDRVAYLMLWPHAQPWRLARARPMLRGIPDAAKAGAILGQALANATLISATGGSAQPLIDAPRKDRTPAASSSAQRPRAAAMA